MIALTDLMLNEDLSHPISVLVKSNEAVIIEINMEFTEDYGNSAYSLSNIKYIGQLKSNVAV